MLKSFFSTVRFTLCISNYQYNRKNDFKDAFMFSRFYCIICHCFSHQKPKWMQMKQEDITGDILKRKGRTRIITIPINFLMTRTY